MKKVVLVINEQHKLLEEQRRILEERFGKWKVLSVPANGWTLKQQEEKVSELIGNVIIFASPIPYMLKRLAFYQGYGHEDNCFHANGPLVGHGTEVLVFHNDKREKRELPDGKVVYTVAKTGWQLIQKLSSYRRNRKGGSIESYKRVYSKKKQEEKQKPEEEVAFLDSLIDSL